MELASVPLLVERTRDTIRCTVSVLNPDWSHRCTLAHRPYLWQIVACDL